MITELRLKNFKALADATIPLDRLTVLVGGNGTGKSTVLQALQALSSVMSTSESQLEREGVLLKEWAPHRVRTAGTTEPLQLAVSTTRPRLDFAVGTMHDDFDGEFWQMEEQTKQPSSLERRELQHASSSARLQLDARQLAEAAVTQEQPRMAYDGSGLADVLAWLASSDPEAKERIEAAVGKIVPRALRYRVQRTKVLRSEEVFVDGISDDDPLVRTVRREVIAQRFEVEFKGAGWIPAEHLSEGTLIAMGLMTALNTPDRPRLILLDDLDRALHPRAQREVVDVLKKLLDEPTNADLQIIATTHSPFVVDCVESSAVRVMSVDKDEHAVCKKLTDHPDWERWRTSLRAGEFWSFVGEDWMFGA